MAPKATVLLPLLPMLTICVLQLFHGGVASPVFLEETPSEDAPIVQTANGRVQGFRIPLDDPALEEAPFAQADIFLGIPFAQPPINELRLEKPLPAENWTGTLDASAIPPACVPQHLIAAPDFSEDCLYLNVFRPAADASKGATPTSAERALPVLVFIHGGGFCVGGSFVEGYANLSNNFVAQGIVVVTLQYRLNFLGFFSDGSSENPGNLGLWDQRQALLWVRDNIGAFGGDASRVTVWGQSAGAASTSILSLSPHTRDLFRQAIQMSGSFLSPWALNDRVGEGSLQTARALHCEKGAKNGTKNQLKECIKKADLDDLIDAISSVEMVRSDFAMAEYNPRPDGQMIPLDLAAEARKAPHKPTLMGFTPHEAMFLTLHYPASVFAFDSPLTVADPRAFGRAQLTSFIRDRIKFDDKGNVTDAEKRKLVEALCDYYAGSGKTRRALKQDSAHFLEQYTLLLSDIQFIVPILAETRLKAAQGWPVYVHQFDHLNRKHAKQLPFRGVVHGAEYPFLVGVELFGNYALDEEDKKVRAMLVHAYGTFIKNGVPNSLLNGSEWPPLGPNPNSPIRAMHIGQGPHERAESNPRELAKKAQFWRKLARGRAYAHAESFPKMGP